MARELPGDWLELPEVVNRYNDDRAEMYQYASGRWLHQDHIHRQARIIPYNIQALSQKIVEIDGEGSHITRCIMKEGKNNKAFIFILANGHELVARMPFSTAGPRKLTTQSEVATMKYRTYFRSTSFQITAEFRSEGKYKFTRPKELAGNMEWIDPVAAEYIIMERKPGVILSSKWGRMVTEQHVQAIRKVAQLCKKTYNLQFPANGSLYFSDVVLEEGDSCHLRNGYCIGPHVGQDF